MNTKIITKQIKKFIVLLLLVGPLAFVMPTYPTGHTNVATDSPCGSGYALNFDGINDFVDFGTSNIFEFSTGDFSIEFWVKYTDLTGEQILIEKFTYNDGPGWTFTKMPYNVIRFATSCCDEIDGTPPSLVTNTWYHIAVVRSSNVLSYYWNGAPFASGTNANSTSGGGNLLLGRRNNNGGYLNGMIDEVRIWNVARTPIQIQNNMIRLLVGNEQGLIGYWRFDDGNGTTVHDLTSNHNDGTMINMDPNSAWIPSPPPIGYCFSYLPIISK